MNHQLIANMINKNKQAKNTAPKQRVLGSYSKYLISKNSEFIIESVLEEIKDFTQSPSEKQQSLSALYNLVEACGNGLSKYSEKVLFALYKNADHEEEIVKQLVKKNSELIGKYFHQDILISTALRHLQDNEIKNSHVFSNCLNVFSSLLKHVIDISYPSIKMILDTLKQLDIFNGGVYQDKNFKEIVINIYDIYANIVQNLKEANKLNMNNNNNLVNSDLNNIVKSYHSDLFYALLILQSIPILPQNLRQDVNFHFQALTEILSLDSIPDLYNLELLFVLSKFKESHNHWKRNTADRFAFDTYVKQAGDFLNFDSGENWIRILEIVSDCTEANKDIEMRMDMIILIENLITNAGQNSPESSLSYFSDFILEQILLPASIWRAQRPNYNVRKGAIISIIKLFQYNLVDKNTVVKYFSNLVSVLKSSLEDDWDCELRNISIKLLLRLFERNIQDNYKYCYLGEEELRELYPLMLKRLDDAQDENRKLVSKVFELFFTVIRDRVKMSDSTVEYIIQTAFIHLDDNKIEIRKSIYDFLKVFASIDKISYQKILKETITKESMRFTNKSDYLLELNNIVNKNSN